MFTPDESLYAALLQRGLSRRTLLKFGTAMATALAMPLGYAPRIVRAVESAPRMPLIWLHGLACGGNTQAFLQSANPTTADLLVQTLSLDYDDLLAAGSTDPASSFPDGYLLAVDGAVPIADKGVHCTVGGQSMMDVLRVLAPKAKATIAVGSCAFDGGASAAAGGSTSAVGAGTIVGSANLVNLPGCPVNVENLAATFVHLLTFGELPPTDRRGRPYFAYGGLIHNQCERRPHFEYGEFVTSWGDEGAQKGWCLYKMGCKGPETFANCPTAKYAAGTSWAVLAGHGCIGCTMPGFWDTMGGAYERLPAPIAYAPNVTADQIGLLMVGGVGAATVVHGGASTVRQLRNRRIARNREPEAGAVESSLAEPQPIVAEAPEPTAVDEPESAMEVGGGIPQSERIRTEFADLAPDTPQLNLDMAPDSVLGAEVGPVSGPVGPRGTEIGPESALRTEIDQMSGTKGSDATEPGSTSAPDADSPGAAEPQESEAAE